MVGKPEVAGCRILDEDQAPHDRPLEDVTKGGVAPLVRAQVRIRKLDRVSTEVVVDGQVAQPLVAAVQRAVAHELRGKHPGTALAVYVVHAVHRRVNLPGEESDTLIGPYDPSCDDRAVFIAVVAK
jgi:hypothetical protein